MVSPLLQEASVSAHRSLFLFLGFDRLEQSFPQRRDRYRLVKAWAEEVDAAEVVDYQAADLYRLR